MSTEGGVQVLNNVLRHRSNHCLIKSLVEAILAHLFSFFSYDVPRIGKLGSISALRYKFVPEKSEANAKPGVFVGPEICEPMLNNDFKGELKLTESAAWEALVQVVQTFLAITEQGLMLSLWITC